MKSEFRWTIVLMVLIALCSSGFASKCDNLTGFMKQLCDSQASRANGSAIAGKKLDAFTTDLSDSVHAEMLPGSIDAKGFERLGKLGRTETGAFILSTGLYEAEVEAFTLDSGGTAGVASAGFWPAPIKGSRAAIIGEVLRNAELHPELAHADIQELLIGLCAGADLRGMSAQAQQAAVLLLTKDEVTQLGGIAKTGGGQQVLDWVIKQAGNNKQVQKMSGDAQKKADNLGLSGVFGGLGQSNTTPKPVAPVVKSRSFQTSGATIQPGTWVKMPEGFYIRYLAEGNGRVKLQLAVPEWAGVLPALQHVVFDPTQFIAVSGGSQPARLGITMRGVMTQ